MKILFIGLVTTLSLGAFAQSNRDYQDMSNDRYWVEKESNTPENKSQALQNLEVCTHENHAPILLPQESHDLTFDACKNAILDAVETGVSDKEIINTLIKNDSGDLMDKVEDKDSSEPNPYVPNEIKG